MHQCICLFRNNNFHRCDIEHLCARHALLFRFPPVPPTGPRLCELTPRRSCAARK